MSFSRRSVGHGRHSAVVPPLEPVRRCRGLVAMLQTIPGIEVVGHAPDGPVASTAHSCGVEVAAYRIAMEAVTNSARHGGTDPARFRIEYEDDSLTVIVSDGGPLGDAWVPGVAVSSMREQTAEVGGTLHVSRDEVIDGPPARRSAVWGYLMSGACQFAQIYTSVGSMLTGAAVASVAPES